VIFSITASSDFAELYADRDELEYAALDTATRLP
jgi:hypothetical protein